MDISFAYKEFTRMKLKSYAMRRVPLHLETSGFMDDAIYKSIKEKIKEANEYSMSFSDVSIKLSVAFRKENRPVERFLLYYACFLVYLFKEKCGKPMRTLSISLIGYEGKKRLPRLHGENLTPMHVNGGVTWSGIIDANVVVYRREEIVKVLTHEMIHAFNLDAKSIPIEKESFVNEYFKIECKSATLNESFTDSLACYINAAVYAHLQRTRDFQKAFARNLKKERRHILSQASKVLFHNKYEKKGDAIHRKESICEHTHVTSYYVIKAVIWRDLTPFIEMIRQTRMNIDVDRYLEIVREGIPILSREIKIEKPQNDSMRMSSLDILRFVRARE